LTPFFDYAASNNLSISLNWALKRVMLFRKVLTSMGMEGGATCASAFAAYVAVNFAGDVAAFTGI